MLCTQRELDSPSFRHWISLLAEPFRYHRKLWEYAYVAQALLEREMLTPGRHGIGFAVGIEPMPALFASLGVRITATDQQPADAERQGWISTSQYATQFSQLNARGICPEAAFYELVDFQWLDMNSIPSSTTPYDFAWSICAIEHLGSIRHGLDFLGKHLKLLKPGGVAVHTFEYNLWSNEGTIETPPLSLYRMRDVVEASRALSRAGHCVEPFDHTPGSGRADLFVDPPPYRGVPAHLKLLIENHCCTSGGLIITKAD